MPPSSRIPPLLQPCVRLPKDESILLLTSTLGATANWLIIRFLCDALSSTTTTQQDGEGAEGANVILVSWMREYEFWKAEARKGGGLDLERAKREGRFAFVDGMSGLFLPADMETEKRPQATAPGLPAPRTQQILPVRGSLAERTLPARGPPGATARQGAQATPAGLQSQGSSSASASTPGVYTLATADLAHLKSTVCAAVSRMQSSAPGRNSRTLIILDNPDLLLATSPTLSPSALTSMFLTLRTQPSVSHVLVHLQADTPLLSLSTPAQPLEVNQHNLLVKTAHMSRRVLSVRVLDTGVARDVSGVLRVTETQAPWANLGFEENKDVEKGNRNMEVLYRVGADGNVKVFERGAGGEG